MELIALLAILTFMFWFAFKITGAVLSAVIWLVIKLPIAMIIFCLGIVCCATLLLIPVGIKLFKLAGTVLF